jgi:molybdenum cofactor synthesis domain-containing protein
VADALTGAGIEVVERASVADDVDALQSELVRLSKVAELVVTTGGTGLGPRDRTPKATAAVADYLVPGLAEEMRRAGRQSTPMAVLSRGVAAVCGRSLILNLPGSPAGAVESLTAVLPVLPHALEQLAGSDHRQVEGPTAG